MKYTKTTTTFLDPSGHPKPWKSGPRVYKRAPGPTGAERLQRNVHMLVLTAARLEKKQTTDEPYARALREALQAFLREHQP